LCSRHVGYSLQRHCNALIRGGINPEHMRKTRARDEFSIMNNNNMKKLPVRHFFSELQTNLGLPYPSHPPEETKASKHQTRITRTNKDVPKCLKYIFPSSED
jgi:hypothetical protein